MNTAYIEYCFSISPKEPGTEILIAELDFVGFEGFVESEKELKAYIQKKSWHAEILGTIPILTSKAFSIAFTKKEIEQVNWNSTWEKNFRPIEVDNTVSIRAPFHGETHVKYDIRIEPKMSFGTGHHETTYLMIQYLIALDLEGKKILDMGCGTGILAIFAEKKGAKLIDAVDIDAWSYENALENVARNQCRHISVFQGNASLLKDKEYDVILANINRNTLLEDIEIYAKCLRKKGVLLLSGFYQKDISIVDEKASTHSLLLEKTAEKNNWVALQYCRTTETR